MSTTPTGFWHNGRFVQGLTLKTGGGKFSASHLDLEVAQACARARETGDALTELKTLLNKHPSFSRETTNDELHPLNPLIEVFAQQTFSGPDK
jgi:hypothetical protein